MSDFTGKKIANTYKNLLQVDAGNTDLTTNLLSVQTGAGNNTPLQLSTDKINLGGTIQIDGTTLTAGAATLNAVADLTGATGIVAVSAGTVHGRTIAVGSPLSITNANGTEGNPTINLASSGVSAATYGPMVNFTVDNFGRITDVTATTTISANAFIGGTLSGSALTVENNTSIGGDLVIAGATNMKAVSATDVTFNNLTVGTKITTDTVTATTVETSILRATTASISDLTAGTLTFNNLSTTNLFAVSANATRLFKNGESVATSADVATLSATMATSIANRTSAITSINSIVTDLSATMATSINNRTTAITSINTVVTNLSSTLATSIANVSALSKTNLDAITSINTVVGDLSSTMATSINNRTQAITSINTVVTNLSSTLATSIANVSALSKTNLDAITSINTVVGDLSSTLATSIGNRTSAITSINTVITNLSATLATSIANVDITSVSAFTVNALTVVSGASFGDNVEAKFGTGDDLRIYHDGSNSYIDEGSGTGALIFKSNFFSFRNAPDSQQMAIFNQGGSVRLFHNGAEKIRTLSDGGQVFGDFTLLNSDADASQNPTLILKRDSASPADSDLLGDILFQGNNDNSEAINYAQIHGKITDASDSSEGGYLEFKVMQSGSLDIYAQMAFNNFYVFKQLTMFNNIFLDGGYGIKWDGSTNDSNTTTLVVTDPTAVRTITLPDATGDVVLNESGTVNIESTADNGPVLNLISNDHSDAADFNTEANIKFLADNSANEQTEYANIQLKTADVTDGTEDGWIYFGTKSNGTLNNAIAISSEGGFYLLSTQTNHPVIQWNATGGTSFDVQLKTAVPTADRTITLPDATGTVALTSDVATVSATMATSISNRTSAITSINSVITNLSSTFATSINNRTSAITSINTVITNLSSTLAASIANSGGTATTVSAFTIKTSTGGILKLETSDVEVTVGDVLGAIEFKAPDEASGGDANLTAAAIVAESDSVFKSGQNRTDLVFKLGESAVATEKARIKHTGSLQINNSLIFNGATNTTTLTATSTTTNRIIKLPDGKGTIHTTDYPEIITAYGPTASPRTFKVTVQTPVGYYPYQGDGSGLKFHIDGMVNPALELHGADQTTANSEYIYRFDQSDSSNSGHPLRFYLEANKTTAYTVNVTTNGTPGSAGAYTQIAVDQETPKILYYQCSNHDYMGNYITAVNSNTFSNNGIRVGIFDGTNHDRLQLFQNTDIRHTASGTSKYTTLTFDTASSNRTITVPSNRDGTLIHTGNSDTPSTTTASSDADFVLIDDGGTMKKITPANLGIGSGGSGITVQDEGSSLSTAATTLDFVGAGVVASGTGATKTITIAGGGSGITVQDEGSSLSTAGTTLNFVGSGVTASGTGATKTITISGGGGSGGGTTSETWGASLNGKLNIYTTNKNIFIGSQDNATSATEPSASAVSATDCVVIGYNAGKDLTSGNYNTFIGRDAGESNTTGYGNSYVGYHAGKNTTDALANTFMGYTAGRYTTTGDGNTLIGYMAGTATYASAGTMYDNTAVGRIAGKDLTTGYENAILGSYAGENISTGFHNAIVGFGALQGASSGAVIGGQNKNAVVGYKAMNGSSGGYRNSVLGTEAEYSSLVGNQNVAIGYRASYNSTASLNVVIGSQAGYTSTNGSSNVYVGEQAAYYTTGSSNIAIGRLALYGNTQNNNTVIGYEAYRGSSSSSYVGGSYNVALGYRCYRRTSGHSGDSYNTCVGGYAGTGIYSGDYNTFLGYAASSYYNNSSYATGIGYNSRTNHAHCTTVGSFAGYSMYGQSDYTTLVGNYAGYDLDGGDHCTFIGYQCGYAGGSGSRNVGMGNYAIDALSSGGDNVGVGYGALSKITSGSSNAGFGHYAGEDFTTGSNNTFCGTYAGGYGNVAAHTGSNNTNIGYGAMPSSTTVSNEITLGDSNITSLRCQVQTISSLSDQRDKTAIEDLDLGLDFIKAMRPVKFAWNRRDGKWHGKKEVGFIAQELHEVEMDFNSTDRTRLVSYENPSKLEARPMNTYPILVKAIQELSAKVDSLQARITELEGA